MRKVKNEELINYVIEGLQNKNYDTNYEEIKGLIEDSIKLSDDFETDEDGNIKNLMTENEIEKLKINLLDGIEDYLDYKNIKMI